MLTTLQTATFDHFGTASTRGERSRFLACKLFDRLLSQALWERGWRQWLGLTRSLRGRPTRLAAPSRTLHTRLIPIRQIVGSEGRCRDFDARFRPLTDHTRERWVAVAVAFRSGVALPAVELVQGGNDYYVRDGHHRISVARAMGQTEIEARIVN